MRLDQALAELLPAYSRNRLQQWLKAGQLRVDGQIRRPRDPVAGGEIVSGEWVLEVETAAVAQDIPLTIRHEDADLLVIDKPAGLVAHPAAGNRDGTLVNALLHHAPELAALPRAGLVHRLDKDTSGVMVVGKTLEAVTALVRDIAAREVRRQYLALAWGEVMPGCIDAPVGRDPAQRTRMAVVGSGKPARTDVETVAQRDGISALHCRLHTGRTHQIRVHLAWQQHPLVADALYGGRPALGLQRQALHATRLAFAHPVTRAAIDVTCPPPADFSHAWQHVIAG